MPRLSKIGAAALAAFGWTGLSSVTASYLVVAGGGGGGTDNVAGLQGGGGGAGGFLTGTASLNPTQSYTVTVGAGGSGGSSGGSGSNASNSLITGIATAIGGGGGGSYLSNAGGSGGSGGGGAPTPAGTGTVGQGNNGGTGTVSPNGGGGGGGAGAVGGSTTTPNGGVGLANPITGSTVGQLSGGIYYLAGGGGGRNGSSPNNSGTGGLGGGGTFGGGGAGTANTGGGAGGTGGGTAGSGGSGVVIISYVGAQQFGGGVVTSVGGNTIHTFTTSGTLSPLSSLTASYLIVAGGGAGGGQIGGGGGAGGYQTGSGITLDTNSIYAVTVGAGGTGTVDTGGSGGNSSFSMVSTASVGGGGGGSSNANTAPTSGGSGGGSGGFSALAGGAGTAGQGNAGGIGNFAGQGGAPNYPGGGGGGATGAGANSPSGTVPGSGGAGTSSSISGTSTTYATGGTGGLYNITNRNGVAGTANTGNGGEGAYATAATGTVGGNGGSGIVIISYPGSTQQMAGGTVTVAGGNVIHTFTSSGYLTPIVLVNNSLRFRESASSYLNRTPTTAGNNQKFTMSVWYKPGNIGTSFTNANFISAGGDGSNIIIAGSGAFGSTVDNRFLVRENNATAQFYWPMVFRDPAAWYHIVLAVDTTQTNSNNRAKLYVNGVDQGAFSGTGYSLSATTSFNTVTAHYIGAFNSAYYYTSCYFADYTWIDGQQLTPNSFGTFNGLGVWQPIRYGGSYGTNGFYLPFTLPNNSLSASYLVVAGGGGGGVWSGGGGAGGLLSGSGLTINTNSIYTVTVGSGGAGGTTGGSGDGSNGNNSVFSTLTSIGGGAGQSTSPFTGYSGGSGGGGSYALVGGGAGTAGQGNNGGAGSATLPYSGGGGGAGAVGASAVGGSGAAGAGGAGSASSISGSSVTYAGGGGGAGGQNAGGNWNGGAGGSGGGGAGGTSGVGTSGTANTGGGGGASGRATNTFFDAGSGGSGIVIVSYAGSAKFTGGTITSSGGNTIHTFTSSGTLVGNIAADYSPNGNNWTPNNFSFSSGSTYDSMTDVPTLTSATTANYCVMNPLIQTSNLNLSNGNLTITGTGSYSTSPATFGMSSGKWYWEYTCTTYSASGDTHYGIGTSAFNIYQNTWIGSTSAGWIYAASNGNKYNNNSAVAYGATFTSGDIIGVAFDADVGTLTFYKNGTTQGTAYTGLTSGAYFPVATVGTSNLTNANFGQRPFAYTPPTGFVALNTYNLPTPTIGATASTQANKYMDVSLYTGTGASQSITNSNSMQPDMVWIKSRSGAYDHNVFDSVRGIYKQLVPNATYAENNYTTSLTAFNSNGFSVGSDIGTNNNGSTFVGWQWRASNATAVTNTAGSITSTVSANTTAGFSIVTYTGNGTGGATVGHGLGVAPSWVIVKRRSNTGNWYVYSISIGNTNRLRLDETSASTAESAAWNNTSPTSTVFSIGTSVDVNASGNTFVAYCFAPVAGYSAFGSYTGNGDPNGPFIFTGFRPRFIMIKASSFSTASTVWTLFDTSRSPYNASVNELYANLSSAEGVDSSGIDILSNGFKPRRNSEYANSSGQTYIYMAFAENPFKYANAR